MSSKPFKPYVSATANLPEMTVKAVVLGVGMAIVLGSANAYVGMKAGLTVAATFPAAVVAMALMRMLGGSILEENLARTTASVGEALVAGAIFTLPAFIITGAWSELEYWPSTMIMMIGGILGVLFVIILRRTLVVESDLVFPESVATAEIVKAGQGGQSGAAYLFGGLGMAAVWEVLKNPNGLVALKDFAQGFIPFKPSSIEMLGTKVTYGGGMLIQTPAASPILFGVGYIIGTRISAILFAGALIGWLFLVPLGLFFNPNLEASLPAGSSMLDMAMEVWTKQVRPLAVGTMIVAAFYTLWNLRKSLITAITGAFRQFDSHAGESSDRTQVDLSFKKIFIAIGLLSIPMFFLYKYFSHSIGGALLLTVVMIVLGFLFSAVAGYLVGLIGSSNNPISGLTLSALIISALLMVWIGVTGVGGVAAVLAIAGVVCCAAGVAGDMMQDLKVGYLLGGTPWRMEISEIIGVIAAAAVLTFPLQWMDKAYTIGSAQLPAPQAGLMALLAQGIVGGEMAWGLVIVGMFLAFGLILIGAPSPMLIAVGMYLPFYSTSAIFVGGLMRWGLEFFMDRKKATPAERTRAENVGVLLSSGFIAGESLMAVFMALLVIIEFKLPTLVSAPSAWPGLIIFLVVGFLLIWAPLRAMKSKPLPATTGE